jgi:hypothetical protein
MSTKPITPPTNIIPDKEYKATYISDKLIRLDNGQIMMCNVPGLAGSVVTVTIPRGVLAFPVARVVKDYHKSPKDQVNSQGQKLKYFGNAVALSAKSIKQMYDNMYREPAIATGVDTFGISLNNNIPIEPQNGINTVFTFKDRGDIPLPVITTYSETIYLNGVRLAPTIDYTIVYTTGTVTFVSFVPIVTDVILMDCHKPMDKPTYWENNPVLLY